MREILFRGKDIADNWHYGDLEYITADFVKIVNHRMNEYGKKVEIDTVGQYTGLTDMNGKKIFEGDIVRYGTNTNRADNKDIHEVVFETRGGCGYFGIKISDIETWQFSLEVPAKLMEVIGNIYDTPELLEAKK